MKAILIGILAALLLNSETKCHSKKNNACFKGRLEIKGICSNYTIKILEGTPDTTEVAAQWTDENTGKAYTNVFALDNPCSFPADLKEGDEFYFTVLEKGDKNCQVCMAYYPVPSKRLSIAVSKTPCP